MFVLCPHCEFLVGVDPRTGRPPAACPKCGQALESAQAEDVPAVQEEVPAAPGAPAVVEAAPEPTPEPARPKLDPDAVIAAMAAKPRKPRAKPRAEAKTHASEKAPARRKRAEAPTPRVETPEAAKPAEAPPRSPQPPLATRFAAWWSSRKQAQAPASPEPPPPQPASGTKRKASVRPIPSLRDRAAARAAETRATPVPEIEALSIDEAPTFDSVEPAVVEPPLVESVVVEPPAIEAQPVAPEVVESPAVAAVDAEATAVEPAPLPLPEPRLTARAATPPSFLRKRTGPATSTARWKQFATLGALSLLLAVQLLLAQRDALAADARWRPTIDALCTVARCAVPAWHQPDAFTMLSRDVRPHARAPGTLQIDASFRNDARWAQPWPRLLVTLSDIDGRVLGTRAFTAPEYLGAPPTQNTLASGQSATVRLAVVEPAPGIVAFSFEFR